MEITAVLTIEDVSLSGKTAVIEAYLQAIQAGPAPSSSEHCNLLRQCRLEAYSLLFDLVSQHALQLWSVKRVSQARSVLLGQESVLAVAIDLEEQLERDLKGRKQAKDYQAFCSSISTSLKESSRSDKGYSYPIGRMKQARDDFDAYAVKCQAKLLVDQGMSVKAQRICQG
jgi:hypothetical protein